MKKLFLFFIILVIIFCSILVGCDNSKGNLSIKDIEWSVSMGYIGGKSTVVFSYENKSNFTITAVEIQFKQKDNLTKQELSIFSKYSATEKNLNAFYITANNYFFTDSGETSSIVPCNLIGSYNYCHDMAEYDLMEANKIVVAYIKGNKMFGIEYDYKTKKTTNLSEEGKDMFEWTDNDIANLIPKPRKEVVLVDFDLDDLFSFEIYNTTEKDFQNYLQQCKSKGFTLNADVEDYFGHESYQAENSYGNKLHIYYKSSSNYNSPCRIVVEIQR